MLAPGRTLRAAVHRPFAEQLAELAQPRPGERVLELTAGPSELTAHLRAAVGADGAVEVVERPWGLGSRSQRVDLAVSLLAIEVEELLLGELAAAARRVFLVVAAQPAPYDAALREAWREVIGSGLDTLRGTARVAGSAGWRRQRLSDVARFDGVDQLLMALTDERGIAVPASRRAALRDRLAAEVTAFTAADGTMRIPVDAVLLEHGEPPAPA